jgi:hypothetical protein
MQVSEYPALSTGGPGCIACPAVNGAFLGMLLTRFLKTSDSHQEISMHTDSKPYILVSWKSKFKGGTLDIG